MRGTFPNPNPCGTIAFSVINHEHSYGFWKFGVIYIFFKLSSFFILWVLLTDVHVKNVKMFSVQNAIMGLSLELGPEYRSPILILVPVFIIHLKH